MLDLLLTRLAVVNSILKLSLCDVVETHGNKVLWCKARHHVCIFNQFEALFKVDPSSFSISLILNQVQLVAC